MLPYEVTTARAALGTMTHSSSSSSLGDWSYGALEAAAKCRLCDTLAGDLDLEVIDPAIDADRGRTCRFPQGPGWVYRPPGPADFAACLPLALEAGAGLLLHLLSIALCIPLPTRATHSPLVSRAALASDDAVSLSTTSGTLVLCCLRSPAVAGRERGGGASRAKRSSRARPMGAAPAMVCRLGDTTTGRGLI